MSAAETQMICSGCGLFVPQTAVTYTLDLKASGHRRRTVAFYNAIFSAPCYYGLSLCVRLKSEKRY